MEVYLKILLPIGIKSVNINWDQGGGLRGQGTEVDDR
jgi:hypothetical protein